MDQKIIAFAGRARSGKNTSCNFLASILFQSLGISEKAWIDKLGRLCVSDIGGDKRHEGILDMQSKNPNVISWLDQHVHPFIKIYSFADLLKKNICMDILGLSYNDVYGEGKENISEFNWEDMPTNTGKEGKLSNRELLQYIGTEIFRKIKQDVWPTALLKQIKREESALATICDIRFKNEAIMVQEAGGIVVKLTRNSSSLDFHSSEKEIDEIPYDFVIKNDDMSIKDQCKEIYQIVKDWDCLPEIK